MLPKVLTVIGQFSSVLAEDDNLSFIRVYKADTKQDHDGDDINSRGANN